MQRAKKVLIIAATVFLMFGVTGCAKKGTCEACGKRAVLYRFTATSSLLGLSDNYSSKLCSDCLDKAIKAVDEEGMGLTTYTYEEIK